MELDVSLIFLESGEQFQLAMPSGAGSCENRVSIDEIPV
jgi:hypothetical protein